VLNCGSVGVRTQKTSGNERLAGARSLQVKCTDNGTASKPARFFCRYFLSPSNQRKGCIHDSVELTKLMSRGWYYGDADHCSATGHWYLCANRRFLWNPCLLQEYSLICSLESGEMMSLSLRSCSLVSDCLQNVSRMWVPTASSFLHPELTEGDAIASMLGRI
jgi:hypothetical protein